MKRIKYTLFFVLSFIFGMGYVFAAPTHSISAKKQIEVGQNVTATVTLKNAASWDVKVNGTGNTNGCSAHEADASKNGNNITKTISVTCRANSTGIIRIAYSGDATSSDGTNVNVSGSTTVTVVPARPKSTNNYLKSLSIEGATISPDFDKNTLEYTATLEAGIEKVIINAEKEDGYASLDGTGEKDVVEGDNKFEIIVTSETGEKRTYTLVITVKEFDPIIINYDGKKYTIVRKLVDIEKPEGFEETTVKIGEDDVAAFYNKVTKKTIVVAKDESGKNYFFIYNKDGKYDRYIEFTFEKITLEILKMNKSLLPNGYKKYTEDYNNEKIEVYKYSKNSNFALVYALDTKTGEKALYQIDLKNSTVQLYNNELIDALNSNNKTSLIIFGVLGGVVLIEFLFLLSSKKKRNKILSMLKNDKIEKVKKEAINEAKEESVDGVEPEKHEEIPEENKKKKKSKK